MQKTYYQNKLYPLQDKVLEIIEKTDLDFYLTGGTALGRFHLEHRYSDDLDFFVNDNKDFKKQCNSAVDSLKNSWKCNVATTSASFLRLFLEENELSLKIDFVNDIPVHFGDFRSSPIYYRVDNWRNILSNKLCALSRLEAKDIVDILFIAKKFAFEWEQILNEAREKDLWVDPLEICKLISQFPFDLFKAIKWIKKVNLVNLKQEIGVLHDDIFSGASNSLCLPICN